MNMEVGTMTVPQAMGAVTSLVSSCWPVGNLEEEEEEEEHTCQ